MILIMQSRVGGLCCVQACIMRLLGDVWDTVKLGRGHPFQVHALSVCRAPGTQDGVGDGLRVWCVDALA